MGLDMYLYKKTYVKNWDFMTDEEKHEIVVKRGGKVVESIKPERIAYIVEQVGYWRKANAIHKWFVDNVQEGEDDCKEYYVDTEKLKELLNECNKVLDKEAEPEDVLPSESGFFFGSTEYDEWYYNDIEQTKKMIEELLAEEETGDFYYRSSW